MKKITILPLFLIFSSLSFAQTTITLQPDSTGKDAVIWYLDDQSGQFGPTNDTPRPNHKTFQAQEWTWGGSVGTTKSLLDFDLSSLPANSTITSAELSLYAFPASGDGGHLSLSGSNEAYLQEITSAWDENLVTWNTQPTTSPIGQIVLAESIDENDDYLNIDVTTIMQNKLANSASSHGFMISIINQNYYRRMIFGSSDNPDPNLRPKLEITYTTTSGLTDEEIEIVSMYPNPTNDLFYIELASDFYFTVTDVSGKEVISETAGKKGITEINLSDFDSGAYFVNVVAGQSEVTKIIQKK